MPGREVHDHPKDRASRKKQLEKSISFDPIICEYRWVDALYDDDRPSYYRFYRDGRVSYWYIDGFYHGFRIRQQDADQIVSCIEKDSTYALPTKIKVTSVLDGIYQAFSFFDNEGHEIVEISGDNPWYVYKEIRNLTYLLESFIETNISRLPRLKPKYDMFNANRHSEALSEAKSDVEDILQNIISGNG